MTERASIFESVYIGPETTPGVRVAATKRLQGLTVTPGVKTSINTYKATGVKFPSISTMGKEWVEAGVSGPMAYTDIVYLLSSVLHKTTPVLASDAYTWTFSPDIDGPDTPQTYSIEQGSSLRAMRFAYALLSGLTLTINREECTLTGSLFARALEDDTYMSTNAAYSLVGTGVVTGGTFTLTVGAGTTTALAFGITAGALQTALEALATVGVGNVLVTGGPAPSTALAIEFIGTKAQMAVTLTVDTALITGGGSMGVTATAVGAAPTWVDLVPVTSPQVLVYIATTQAGLAGATALQRSFAVSMAIDSRYGPVWVLNGNTSYAAHVETAPSLAFSTLLEADDEGMAMLPKMRTGDTVWLRIKAISNVMVAGAIPYSLTIDAATKISEMGDFSDEDGVYAVEWSLAGVADPTWGKAVEITVVNDIATL